MNDKKWKEYMVESACVGTQPPQMKKVNMDTMMPEKPSDSHPRDLEKVDKEGRMAKSQLFRTMNYAREIHDNISDEDQLEGWVQSKITKAADYLSSVKHYLQYEYMRDKSEAMPMHDEPPHLPLAMESKYAKKFDLLSEEVNKLLKEADIKNS
tara:strand:+ start:7448 stop:7906 length:459 start_codon:yes stop_codon:yes gene_type:complete